jgi:hypothetical protein
MAMTTTPFARPLHAWIVTASGFPVTQLSWPQAEPFSDSARPAEFTTSELLFRAAPVALRGGMLFAHL